MIGSRFTNQAESNYAPIEGECLAVTYALEKTKYYTLRASKLIICVDHKPLLGILNDTALEKVENRRHWDGGGQSRTLIGLNQTLKPYWNSLESSSIEIEMRLGH